MEEIKPLIVYPNVLSLKDLNDIEKLVLSDIIQVQQQGKIYNFASRYIGWKFVKSPETMQEIFQALTAKKYIQSIERKGKSWIRRVIDIDKWVGNVNDTATVENVTDNNVKDEQENVMEIIVESPNDILKQSLIRLDDISIEQAITELRKGAPYNDYEIENQDGFIHPFIEVTDVNNTTFYVGKLWIQRYLDKNGLLY